MTLVRTALLAGRQLSRYTKLTSNAARLASNSHKLAAGVSSVRSLASASAGNTLQSLAMESPHVEAIRYEHKNEKWTLKHVDYHSDSLAIGLLECGLVPGDVVLSWLPLHFGEQVSTSSDIKLSGEIFILTYFKNYPTTFPLSSIFCNLPVPRLALSSTILIPHWPLATLRLQRKPLLRLSS